MTDVERLPVATLRFFADELTIDAVRLLIREKPAAAVNKGEKISPWADRRSAVATTGTWFITSENRHLGSKPEAHLSWVVRLAKDHIDTLRRQFPTVRADLSLLVQDRHFVPSALPKALLRRAVEVGDLEIENPETGMDLLLNSKNLARELRMFQGQSAD